MINNTFKHISDEAKFVSFDPTGTGFPDSTTNVQEALGMTSPTSPATEQAYGVIKIASLQEVLDGVDDTKAVTPAKLKERLRYPSATENQEGIIQIATNAEANAGIVTNKSIVPSSLKFVVDYNFNNRIANENDLGTIKLSSQAAAIAGVDHTTAMTPLRVKEAIAEATKLIPSYTTATESTDGLVRLATAGQTEQGTLRAGFAVSPYALSQLTGNQNRRGIVQSATIAQVNAGTDESVYVSAKGFRTYNATTSSYGTVTLTDDPGTAGVGVALSSNAKIVRLNQSRQDMSGVLNINGQFLQNNSPLVSETQLDDHMPIGSIMMYMGEVLPSNKWEICDGGSKSKTDHPLLFQRYGYKFGGFGDSFNKPDMRGLFVRGAGVGRDILGSRGFDAKNKPLLGNDVTGGAVGEIQKQQVIKHKHVMSWGETYGNPPFGETNDRQGTGSGKSDGGNPFFFTNDGTEIEAFARRNERSTVNSEYLMGTENRPWNISVYYIIKVK